MSQTMHRRTGTLTQRRLQHIFDKNKQSQIGTRIGTPFGSLREGQDKHNVLSGSSKLNQYQQYLAGFGPFELAGEEHHITADGLLKDLPLQSQESLDHIEACLQQVLKTGSNQPNNSEVNAMTNYAFKPSILHHLNNDMQFKQVFKGMTGTKDV